MWRSLRQWPSHTGGLCENFASVNRGKRSVVLDLKPPEDLAFARKLGAQADVVVENNRPGAMARLGPGCEALSRQYPQLIYCSISAYGQTGPLVCFGNVLSRT